MKKSDLTPHPGVEGYLPGCYAHMRPKRDESLPGFLLRLAEANHYRDIQGLLSAVFPEAKETLRPKLASIRRSAGHLARLGRVACGDAMALAEFHVSDLPSRALLIHGCRVPPHGFLPDGESFCPQCLKENGYAREEWELSPVAVCSHHRCELQDSCPQCGQKVSWKRSRLTYCNVCGGSLMNDNSGGHAVSDAECEVAANYSALADFRVEFAPKAVGVISWEEMLNVAQAISQPPEAWIAQAPCRTHEFSRLPLARRRSLIGIIAQIRDPHSTYQLHKLQSLAHHQLTVLKHFLPAVYIAECSFKFLMNCEELSPETARAISGESDLPQPGDGARLFNGRPPSISSQKDVSKFLDIDWQVFRYLRRKNHIPYHEQEISLGIDIDYLLEAKHYIEHRLASLDVIGRMIGVPVTWENLAQLPVKIRWPDEFRGEKRVPFDDLRELQLMWLDKLGTMTSPAHPIRLSEVVTENTISRLSSCLYALLNGHFSKCQWSPPYRWIDFAVEREELSSLNFASYIAAAHKPGVHWLPNRHFVEPTSKVSAARRMRGQ